ncbi:GNAT family N-acetyltransferase [Propionispora hippei]|uniref:Ribosomal protein S18 acetylase RimI n=1 Tax=Propionispora hippei DSM 15287 TaxID=1123003 RepID=A0A1M6I924_9FIRM|nr:GNAT family N-acetyltransferase [Propionispora hippei]SHJ31009.1 Ribosomal protein S18 acetylase RimI [Propionispora hippei DSM 15287]
MLEVTIRMVRPEEAGMVADIEAICFPRAEAASRESFEKRIAVFPDYFLVAETGGTIIGFINGCVTNSPVIYDEMFHDTRHHIPNGSNVSIFGLDVLPSYRKQGIATRLMQSFIQLAKRTGRKKVILTCKENLVHYYEAFGYISTGLSASTHGGSHWYDMTLNLPDDTSPLVQDR